MCHSRTIMIELFSHQKRIISGDKGIGKSFTYLLYSYLSSFVLEARLQQRSFNLCKGFYKELFSAKNSFYSIEKMFYVTVKDIN